MTGEGIVLTDDEVASLAWYVAGQQLTRASHYATPALRSLARTGDGRGGAVVGARTRVGSNRTRLRRHRPGEWLDWEDLPMLTEESFERVVSWIEAHGQGMCRSADPPGGHDGAQLLGRVR